jgi:hypothetical protein
MRFNVTTIMPKTGISTKGFTYLRGQISFTHEPA